MNTEKLRLTHKEAARGVRVLRSYRHKAHGLFTNPRRRGRMIKLWCAASDAAHQCSLDLFDQGVLHRVEREYFGGCNVYIYTPKDFLMRNVKQ